LIYDPTKSYTNGSAVVISLEDGEIYTASLDVPAASDGSNGPNGANASTYWGDSSTTTQQFESNNPTFLDDLPSDINTTSLSTQVGKLTNPSSSLRSLLDAVDMGNGWYSSSWFGLFFLNTNNWVFHSKLGWIYVT